MAELTEEGSEQEQKRVEGLKSLATFEVTPESSILLGKTQAEAEGFTQPWAPGRLCYGALPHFADREQIIAGFPSEAAFFAKYYTPGKTEGKPVWMDASYGEGIVLFEMKFGKKLSEFVESILIQYPDLGKLGKEISLFGISGSGKSTAIEALVEKLGPEAIVMDSDTVRYNLFGKMIADAEATNGKTLEQVRGDLLHNNISGSLYLAINHVAKELKARGYTVIRASVLANEGADQTLYVEHPTIDPEKVTNEEVEEVAKKLFEVTQSRVSGADDYDWDHASTELDFNKMKPVSVQVPERVHGIFVKGARGYLVANPKVQRLVNPSNADAAARKANFRKQFDEVLGE